MLTPCRIWPGNGLKAYLITQDIRQIVDAYGQNGSIVSNCHIRIAFAPNQYETAELLSKMTGTKTVQKASYNFSGSRFSPVMGHVNASVDHIERPLMTPDEILRVRPPRRPATVIRSDRRTRTHVDLRGGTLPNSRNPDALFRRSGPRKKVDDPAAKALLAIENGEVSPQRPLGRTPREISRPENADPDESDLTPIERGVLEELVGKRRCDYLCQKDHPLAAFGTISWPESTAKMLCSTWRCIRTISWPELRVWEASGVRKCRAAVSAWTPVGALFS